MSALYDSARQCFLDGIMGWRTGEMRAMLVRSAYVFDPSHEFTSDLGPADNGRSEPLSGKTSAAGVAGASDVLIEATRSVECNAVIVFEAGSSRLVAYLDDVKGFPIKPAVGFVLEVKWDMGPNRIFKL